MSDANVTSEAELVRVGSEGAFRKRTAIVLGVVASVSLLVALGLLIFGRDVSSSDTAGANAYSRSALGHHGFTRVLRALEIPVVVSQSESHAKAAGHNVLVLAEPLVYEPEGVRGDALRMMVGKVDTAIVVLPKWWGTPDPTKPSWVADVSLLPLDEIDGTLRALRVDAELVRPEVSSVYQLSEFHGVPSLNIPQLLRSDSLEPIVYNDQGMLVAQTYLGGTRIWIVSDPDLINNHGLGRGDNAVLAVELIEALREGDGAVVFDETMHGFQQDASLWAALLEFPLVLASIQVLLTLAILLWAGTGRFGAPVALRPVIAPGKGFLIRNTAELLRFGGHADHALRRYLRTTISDVASAVHLPLGLGPAETQQWLTRLADARGIQFSLVALVQEVEAVSGAKRDKGRAVVSAAHRIYRWRQEMIHGPAGHSTPR